MILNALYIEAEIGSILETCSRRNPSFPEIARAVRVASAVRKMFLVALFDNGKIRYFSVSRRIDV